MGKKLWSNAEVVELGVESTKCEEGLVDEAIALDGEKIIFGCPYCNNTFWTKEYREAHIKNCHPEQREPGNMLPGDTFPVPTFS